MTNSWICSRRITPGHPDHNESAGNIVTDHVDVVVYRSNRRADTYLYLPASATFEELPEALRHQFGEATAFLEFALHADRYLAQADADTVLKALAGQGFYLQLPPGSDE